MSVREHIPSDEGGGLRIAIVAAQWNDGIVRRLLDGALATLAARGVHDEHVNVRRVPGSFELPLAAQLATTETLATTLPRFDAVIALGCVIRGETEHFRLVADAAAQGLLRVELDTGVPVLNGVLAVETQAQAEARSGGEHGNTGSQVALAAIRMANLKRDRWSS